MLQEIKQEHVFRDKESFIQEPWREINNIVRNNLKDGYERNWVILLNNIEDCNKIPEVLKFVALDYNNLVLLVYREPELKVFVFQDYNTLVHNLKINEQKLFNEGLKPFDEDEYKRVFLFKDLDKQPIKELTKGETTIKPGMFLCTCWGYDQTNVEMFVIKKILGKNYFIIQEVAQADGTPTETPTYDNVKVSPTVKKIDLPCKGYISNDGYMSVCERGYKRGLSITDMNEEHYKTNSQFGH